MSDDRPARYVEPYSNPAHPHITERVVYRASSLGRCERAIVALARGVTARPHPDWFQEVLNEGTAMEPVIRAMFHEQQQETRATGFVEVVNRWQDQAELEMTVANVQGRLVIVRAHADDLLITDDGALLREYKKFRDSTWDGFVTRGVEVQPYYPWQVAAMMWALRDAGHQEVICQFIGGHLVDGEITEVHHHVLIDPPIPRAGILKRIARLERLIGEGYDPLEVPCTKQYPCGVWFLHDDQIDGQGAADVVVLGDEATALGVEWVAADQHVRQLKAALAAAEKRKQQATEALRTVWPDDTKKAQVGDDTFTRVIRVVEEAQITRKGYTSDYFQRKAANDARE